MVDLKIFILQLAKVCSFLFLRTLAISSYLLVFYKSNAKAISICRQMQELFLSI